MLIASYNRAALGDVLLIMTAPATDNQMTVQKGDVVRLFAEDGTLIGFNLLHASDHVMLDDIAGQVILTEEQVAQINVAIKEVAFEDILSADLEPKFVVGYVETAEAHPDSDHLKITSTVIDHGQKLQIVSGSPNMQANIKVVVAKVGAMMPSGLIIWPGALRGVASNGMIVSGRELQLPNAPQVPGALILPDNYAEIGTSFDPKSPEAQKLFQ